METKQPSILASLLTEISLFACIVAAISLVNCGGSVQPSNNTSVIPGIGATTHSPGGSGNVGGTKIPDSDTGETTDPTGEETPEKEEKEPTKDDGSDVEISIVDDMYNKDYINLAISSGNAQPCKWEDVRSGDCHVVYVHLLFQLDLLPCTVPVGAASKVCEQIKRRDGRVAKTLEDLTTIVGLANPSSTSIGFNVFNENTASLDNLESKGIGSTLFGYGRSIHADVHLKKEIPSLSSLFNNAHPTIRSNADGTKTRLPKLQSKWIPIAYRGDIAPVISSVISTRNLKEDPSPNAVDDGIYPEIALSEQSTVYYSNHDAITHGTIDEVFHNWKYDNVVHSDNVSLKKKRWTHLSLYNPGEDTATVMLRERIIAKRQWATTSGTPIAYNSGSESVYRQITIAPGQSWDSAGAEQPDRVCKVSPKSLGFSNLSKSGNDNCWWNLDGIDNDESVETRHIGLYSTLTIDSDQPVIAAARMEVRSTHGTGKADRTNLESKVSPTDRRKEALNGVIDEINGFIVKQSKDTDDDDENESYRLYGPAFFNGVTDSSIQHGSQEIKYSQLTLYNHTDKEITDIDITFQSNDGDREKKFAKTVGSLSPGEYWNSFSCDEITGLESNFPQDIKDGYNEGWFEVSSRGAAVTGTLTTTVRRVTVDADGKAVNPCKASKVEVISEVLSDKTYSEASSFRFAKNQKTGKSRNTGWFLDESLTDNTETEVDERLVQRNVDVYDQHWTYLEIVNTGNQDATVTVNQHIRADGKQQTREVPLFIPAHGRIDTKNNKWLSDWFDGEYTSALDSDGETIVSPTWIGMYTAKSSVDTLIFSERQEFRNDLVDSYESSTDIVTEWMIFPKVDSSLRVLDRYVLPGK